MTASRLCWLVLAASILRLWVMPLPSSFWVDEMGTVFVVQRGAGDPSLAVAPQVSKSIYYALPWASHALLGSSEAAWRLPSLVAMGAALLLIARLAARLIHPGAAWFAAFACLALRGFSYQAADARPYGLGTLVACGALFFLVRWLDDAKWRNALPFLVCGALLWRVHLLFWPFYFVFLAYMAVRAARRENQVGAVRLGAVISLLGIVLAPVFLDAMSLYRQAGQHVVMALPSVRDLVASLKFGLVLVCGGGAYLAMRLRRRRGDFPVAGKASVVLVLSWWLCQPLCLFAASWLTGRSVFVPRYLWLALPGAALAATLAASRFIPAKLWKPAAAALGLGALLLNGQWSRPWPLHHNSDWRRAADAIEGSVKGPDVPVICPSPFIEAKTPVWSPEYRLPGFLYAQLYVYPIPGRIYPFPFESSPEAEAFAARLSKDVFPGADRFLIYGGAGHVAFWSEWFERRPELARWRNTPLGPFADVEVVLFERP